MGNANWVCFDCREAVRRPTHYPDAVPCPHCGRACHCLGTKIRIPARGDESAWRDLRIGLRERRHAVQQQQEWMRARLRHRLERQIADLEARPSDAGRARTIQHLRQRLASL